MARIRRRSLVFVVIVLVSLVFSTWHLVSESRCAEHGSQCFKPCVLNCQAILPQVSLEELRGTQLSSKEIMIRYHNPSPKLLHPPPKLS